MFFHFLGSSIGARLYVMEILSSLAYIIQRADEIHLPNMQAQVLKLSSAFRYHSTWIFPFLFTASDSRVVIL